MFELRPAEVESAARRAASWLAAQGARAGDRVAVVAGNRPELLALTSGALRTGVIPVLLNSHLPPADVEWMLADCRPAVVVREPDWPSLQGEALADLAPFPLGRPMHYTSGTTGRSKGVWGGLFSEQDAAGFAADEADLWGAGDGDTLLVCSPLYHSAPHRSALSALLHGSRVLVFERFDAAEVAAAFTTQSVTGAFLVPTHLRRLLEARFEAASARRVLHAGEPCPETVKREALGVFPQGSLFEFYGSTEGQFSLISSEEWLERPGSVGRAREGRALSVRTPADDGVGTVYTTAPSFWRWEYWGDREKTEAAWDGDIFTVGDLGRLDDDGFLYLSGRREDLIISGGVNVYPKEVERVLAAHPDVREVAVFGVGDPEWGQRVCAAVVGDVDPDELRGWARERLAGSHAPKTVLVLEALPRTATGKLRRGDLRDRAQAAG